MNYSEFEFIEKLKQSNFNKSNSHFQLGIGDDAALIKINDTHSYAICTDTSVLDAHFTPDTPLDAISYKALTTNISDLAAMGAVPLFYLLNITRPDLCQNWCEGFLSGLKKAEQQNGVYCIGGDTTKGRDCFTITAIGLVETDKALLRSGAKPGDMICVSGELGLAAYALHHPSAEYSPYLFYPSASVDLGSVLAGKATACIDTSDGLLADLNHIVEASRVGAKVYLDKVPGLQRLTDLVSRDKAIDFVLTGGDDYELCFTIPEARLDELQAQYSITVIGEITNESGLTVLDKNSQPVKLDKLGFSHF